MKELFEQKYNLCNQIIQQANEPHNIYSRGCSFLGDAVSIPGSTKLVDTLIIEQSSNSIDEQVKDIFDGQVSLAKSFWDAHGMFVDMGRKPLLYANAAMTSSSPRRGSNRAYVVYMNDWSWSYIYLDLGRDDSNPAVKRLQEEIQILKAALDLMNGEGTEVNVEGVYSFIESIQNSLRRSNAYNLKSEKRHLIPGSFNPFHEGHNALVQAVKEEYGVIPRLEIAKYRRGKEEYTVDQYFNTIINAPVSVCCTWNNPRLLNKIDFLVNTEGRNRKDYIFHIGSDLLLRLDKEENPKDFEKNTLRVWERAGYPVDSAVLKRWKKPLLKISKVPPHLMEGVDPHISSTKIRQQNNG